MQGEGRRGIGPVDQFSPELAEPRLHRGLREGGRDRLGKAFEATDYGDQDVLHASDLQLVHHREPELGTFVVGD